MISLPADLKQLLAACPLPWRIEAGARHYKLFIADRMVTVLPKSAHARKITMRSHRNVLAHVRRAIRQGERQ